jgi:hypothetical protein
MRLQLPVILKGIGPFATHIAQSGLMGWFERRWQGI